MGGMISKLFAKRPFHAKLSRHVALRVFLCFIAIEVAVLFPSYERRQKELVQGYVDQSARMIQPWMGLPESEISQNARQTILRRAIATSDLLGIEVFDANGRQVLQVGETPAINLSQWQSRRWKRDYDPDSRVVEVMISVTSLDSTYAVLARYDAAQMREELSGYLWRIIGLILVIGVGVTIGVILILHPMVLRPIYRLREDLRLVGAAIAEDGEKPMIQSTVIPNDELGEVIQVFHHFVGEIYTAIENRKKVETHLLSLNQALQEEVEHRKEIEEDLHNLNVQLQSIAHSDGLTQIANRRYFDQCIDREWRRMARNQTPLALIILDVDFFKQFNDHYGHPAGDDCLMKLAEAIQNAVKRPGDVVARYGGEEFVVVLPETDMKGAKVVAQNIRHAILSLSIPHELSKVSPFVTVSMGVASQVPVPNSQPTAFITVADHALYAAKQQGRDRFCCAFESEGALL